MHPIDKYKIRVRRDLSVSDKNLVRYDAGKVKSMTIDFEYCHQSYMIRVKV